jgi:hypothetical protein
MIKEYERIVNDVGPLLQNIIDKHINDGEPPLFLFGVLMVVLADQFKRFNYNVEDFHDFLEYTKSIWDYEEAKPPRPNLTLIINNENITSNNSIDS